MYIHVPFCFHKCHYCDFYSLVDTRDRQDAFVERLCRELEALAPWACGGPLRTVFVGGGTPSLLRVDLWTVLLARLHAAFDLSRMLAGDGEFTVECNPETVSPELMDVLRAGGVSRVSIGAQSFNPVHLKTLERWHDPANVPRAVELTRRAGIVRQSLDLIYAIPGQTLADWDADLQAALSLQPEHLSCYTLTYEPNTAMAARLARGEFERVDEDLEAEMFEHTTRTLRGAGLDRYEVSNFALAGAECRHNLAYWRQEQWLAAGPSGSAHVGGWRWKNAPRLDDYLEKGEDGFSPVVDAESPDAARAISEHLMTGLRLREGVDGDAMIRRAGASLGPDRGEAIRRVAERQRESGLLTADDHRWRLTDTGLMVANRVILAFMRALTPD